LKKTKPTFKRQRLLLAMLEVFDGKLSKTDFQKLLFLYTTIHQEEKQYNFIPYFYGCYSFQANSDLGTMEKYGFISFSNNLYQKSKSFIGSFINFLNEDEQFKLKMFSKKFKNLRGKNLIQYVYTNYPYFTIHSQIAKNYIDKKTIETNRPKESKNQFFTIGYEGKTIEEYINILIKQNISILVDVRKNAMSMKYGFTKNFLGHTLKNIGIKYIHMPELGIESENRQNLNTQEDYDALFKEYEKATLNNSNRALDVLFSLFKKNGRLAITCYEKDISMCHRGRIAKKIEDKHNITIKNI